jgi:hypothetical protein
MQASDACAGDARWLNTYVADALGPDSLVELHVNAHVRGLHLLLRELLHLRWWEPGRWGVGQDTVFGFRGTRRVEKRDAMGAFENRPRSRSGAMRTPGR